MNNQRFQSIYEGLSTVCKKVYEAVPIQDAWTAQQIKNELERRQSGVTRDAHVFAGCLNSLVHSGVVTEMPKGKFKRVKVTIKDLTQPAQEEKEAPPVTKAEVKATPSALSTIDRLSVLALQLKSLAGEIETAALEIEEQNAVNAEGRKKLEQLQALLKGIA